MTRRSLPFAALLTLAAAAPAVAHPGHGSPASGWLHYVQSPEHWVPLAAVALGSAAGVALLARAQRRGPHRPA
jgi:hydrogenase/urease accessory protein HupE